jgi:thiamine kinase-like enzyme
MAQGLRDAAVSLFDRNATWLQTAQRAWTLMPRNSVSPARPSQGGLVGQYSAFGSWQLDNDQAIILSTAPSTAEYQGIELGNLWFVSLEYETRTSSLTLDQMECSDDGRCYAVISHRDPGIQNWLDTEGHPRGLIMLRWQGLTEDLPDALQPTAILVDFEHIRDALPADVAMFTAEQRKVQIRARRAAIQGRFRG